MTPEAQRIAIAEACGVDCTYTKEALERFKDRDGYPGAIFQLAKVPDYLNDLNTMHEAEKALTAEQQDIYACVLEEMITPDFLGETSELDPHIIMFRDIHATASQRAEAFLRALGLWKEQ